MMQIEFCLVDLNAFIANFIVVDLYITRNFNCIWHKLNFLQEQQVFFKEITEAIMGSDDTRRTVRLFGFPYFINLILRQNLDKI